VKLTAEQIRKMKDKKSSELLSDIEVSLAFPNNNDFAAAVECTMQNLNDVDVQKAFKQIFPKNESDFNALSPSRHTMAKGLSSIDEIAYKDISRVGPEIMRKWLINKVKSITNHREPTNKGRTFLKTVSIVLINTERKRVMRLKSKPFELLCSYYDNRVATAKSMKRLSRNFSNGILSSLTSRFEQTKD